MSEFLCFAKESKSVDWAGRCEDSSGPIEPGQFDVVHNGVPVTNGGQVVTNGA